MKQWEKSLARARYEVRSKAQSIAEIESALRAMAPSVAALDQRVRAEEARTRITDTKRIGYSTVARAARVRSDNLKKSVTALEARLVTAAADHESALAKLNALERSEDAACLLQLPLRDAPKDKPQRRGRQQRTYPLRAVTVIAPSNDNLAGTLATPMDLRTLAAVPS